MILETRRSRFIEEDSQQTIHMKSELRARRGKDCSTWVKSKSNYLLINKLFIHNRNFLHKLLHVSFKIGLWIIQLKQIIRERFEMCNRLNTSREVILLWILPQPAWKPGLFSECLEYMLQLFSRSPSSCTTNG